MYSCSLEYRCLFASLVHLVTQRLRKTFCGYFVVLLLVVSLTLHLINGTCKRGSAYQGVIVTAGDDSNTSMSCGRIMAQHDETFQHDYSLTPPTIAFALSASSPPAQASLVFHPAMAIRCMVRWPSGSSYVAMTLTIIDLTKVPGKSRLEHSGVYNTQET